MGMAASQARYLALVARQSNCEYEGQQINQARLNLSNQSANLFNQMLGLSVPTPPSVQDYTKAQYSFTDGYNPAVIDKWEQLANPDDDGYNYVVEYHYEANVYKGYQKKMNDPQIQFAFTVPSDMDKSAQRAAISQIHTAQVNLAEAQEAYEKANEKYKSWKEKVSQLVTYRDATNTGNAKSTSHTTNAYHVFSEVDPATGKGTGTPSIYYSYSLIDTPATGKTASLWADADGYVHNEYQEGYTAVAPGTQLYCASDDNTGDLTIKPTRGTDTPNHQVTNTELSSYITASGSNLKFTNVEDEAIRYGSTEQKADLDNYIQMWEANGVVVDKSEIYYDLNGNIALKSDLDSLKGVDTGLMQTLYLYHYDDGLHATDDDYQSIKSANDTLATLKTEAENAYAEVKVCESALEELNMPTYIGNSKLTSLGELTQEQLAEIKQIITDMNTSGASTNFLNCFASSLNIDTDSYIGGIYSFVRDGVTYYTTYYDLADTAAKSTFTNDIDNQPKLPYYYATYVKDNVYTTDKAILDTDSRGRFKSVRFKEDGSMYTLNYEQVTDDEAYQDAMNQYYYKNAQYDKMIQDINAKTSIIQQQDQELELRLKQLDTERNALTNEIEAVSKVVKDNVEKSFKTFGG